MKLGQRRKSLLPISPEWRQKNRPRNKKTGVKQTIFLLRNSVDSRNPASQRKKQFRTVNVQTRILRSKILHTIKYSWKSRGIKLWNVIIILMIYVYQNPQREVSRQKQLWNFAVISRSVGRGRGSSPLSCSQMESESPPPPLSLDHFFANGPQR